MKMYGSMMDTVKMAPATINDTWCWENMLITDMSRLIIIWYFWLLKKDVFSFPVLIFTACFHFVFNHFFLFYYNMIVKLLQRNKKHCPISPGQDSKS